MLWWHLRHFLCRLLAFNFENNTFFILLLYFVFCVTLLIHVIFENNILLMC